MQVAKPEATVTEDPISETSAIFVKPIKFVAPLFVNEVKELVPFKILETAVVVEHVLAAAVVVRYDDNELVRAYDDNAEDNA